MRTRLLFVLGLVATLHATHAEAQQNPFAPPRATLHYAPDRTCDLLHVAIDVDVDWPHRGLTGKTVNTLAPLRNGIEDVVLHAGESLEIRSVKLGGKTAEFRRDGRDLHIKANGLTKGKAFEVEIEYAMKGSTGRPGAMADSGWHWIRTREGEPDRVGFWTQGWAEHNSEWAPTWDYSNDLATSETRTTVPADWDVVGNGKLISAKANADKTRKTFHWKLDQPHATYLITLCGGPFDIKKDSWQGVDLWYVVPRGMGWLIDDSFGDTPDMLEFYSKITGVKYAWPKYAQDAMYDFGGGMENVSATTLGEGSLTEARDGFRRMSSLNSHELAHQWFGDLVTCKDWGDVWLNESFATFFQALYFEHAQGDAAYQWQIDDDMRSYFGEARRYRRPISTKLYPFADAMLDSHSYPKGAAVLHTLRRKIGDEAFFAGIKLYLETWKHTPVESSQLRRAFTEATGIEMEPFWAQWIEKPGHPVLDYTWKQEGGMLKVTVKQLQDTSDGTPIYDLPTEVGVAAEGLTPTAMMRFPIHITQKEETFEIKTDRQILALVLDPDHDFLREIPTLHWSEAELTSIALDAPNASDRQEALNRLLREPTENSRKFAMDLVSRDKDAKQPVFRNLSALVAATTPEMRSFWMSQLEHENFDRRAIAVQGLAKLPADPGTTAKLRSLVNEKAPIQVVINAIGALASWDAEGNKAVFERAKGIKDRRGRIARAAEQALSKGNFGSRR